LRCILRYGSRLESGFLFLRGSSFGFSSPFVFADIALFQVFSDCDLLASAFGASFFSTHFCYISLAGASVISSVIIGISFQVYINGLRRKLPLSSRN
jgi:hypothetical protein